MPAYLSIPSKPTSPISYTYFSPINSSNNCLMVILNGLGLPAASFLPSISILRDTSKTCPAILTYDRFGQGLTTSRDPLDGSPGKENGHDFQDVVTDLHEIIKVIASDKLGIHQAEDDQEKLQVMLVGASIGAPLARLYAQQHPGIVAGLILLDSNMANVNYSDFWPDPEMPGFDPTTVIDDDDCTLEQYKVERAKICRMFDLKVKNPEGLDRSTAPQLLPFSDGPKLTGPDGNGPWLTVVGHDPDTFAEMSLRMMGTPKSLSHKFSNPYWARYNNDLTKITGEDRSDRVKIAKGCGHFIQKDDPGFVAREMSSVIAKLQW